MPQDPPAAGSGGVDLTALMATVARDLQHEATPEATLALGVALAVREVGGCSAASITRARRRGRVETSVATDASAERADALQYDAGEGPCLGGLWDATVVDVPDVAVDERWPRWSARMVEESTHRSVLVHRLHTHADVVGALNLYGDRPGAFSDADREVAAALAAHLAVAVHASEEITHLTTALDARTVIGQAQGIVMERFGLDRDAAFALLARLSSHTNRRLAEVATEVVETRVLPD